MSFFTCTQETLLKPLSEMIGFVEKKQTMPILANVYIRKLSSILTLIANDSEIQYKAEIVNQKDGNDFTITLPAKKLQDVLKTLKEGSEVNFEQNNGKINIKSGKSKFVLQSLPPEHFPLLTVDQSPIATFSISQKTLKDLLQNVKYAMAANDSRAFLNGMLFEIKDNKFNLVATDAHRLGFVSYTLAEDTPEISVIVPRKTILELDKLLVNDTTVTIKIYNNQISFNLDSGQIISKIIDGKYPEYDRVIPSNNDKLCLINRLELLQAVQRVSVIGFDKLKTITISLANNTITVSCHNEEQEESTDELLVQYNSESELLLNFNITYVLDVLNNNSEENLQFAFMDNLKSVLITKPNEIDFKYVIMPMRA